MKPKEKYRQKWKKREIGENHAKKNESFFVFLVGIQ